MTASFFASADTFTSADPSASVDLSLFATLSTSANPSTSIGLIALSLSTGPLLPIVLDITRPFYIKKLVTSTNNTTITKILKGTIWIIRIRFSSLNKVWQYILGILDQFYQLEVAKYIVHQQVLSADNFGSKYKTMMRLLNKDWKAVGMAQKTMTDLIRRIQLIVTTLEKYSDNQLRILSDIKKYWKWPFYDRFYNINKALDFDKFFCHLGTIVRQYKHS